MKRILTTLAVVAAVLCVANLFSVELSQQALAQVDDPFADGFDGQLGQEPSPGGMAALGFGFVCCYVVAVLIISVPIGALMFWGVFQKAGQPAWASIVPFYNAYILTKIAGRDTIWFIMMFIPCLNIVPFIVIPIDIARKFGQQPIYALGLILLGIVFYPILGFGNAQYNPNA